MKLKRIAETDTGTYGVLISGGTPFAVTLERPWLNNRKGESCIPTGRYVCKRVQSPKFGNTFEITGVNGRSHILFHKGNLDDDTHGCVLVGESFNPVSGSHGITASKEGFAEFMAKTANVSEFTLDVTSS